MQTICNRINKNEIDVNKRYIFIMVGKNQVFRAVRTKVYKEMFDIIKAIVIKNPMAKMFIAGVLPRPACNQLAKPKIIAINRFLASAVKRIQKTVPRVYYLPVQLRFQAESEFEVLFGPDGIHLSDFGARRLKQVLLEQAGFIRNE